MNVSIFFRLLPFEDKAEALGEAVDAARGEGGKNALVYIVGPESFRQVPGTPFAYWVSERIRRLFTELPPFEGEGRTVKQGLATADDFRFVRAWWEVPPEKILDAANGPDWREDLPAFQEYCRRRTFEGKRWVPFAKGGEYSPYYADIHLVVNWERDGEEIRNFDRAYIRNEDYYFRPGLTWPRRAARFRAAPVQAGCIFSHAGMLAFAPAAELESFLGLMGSLPFDVLIRLRTGSFGGSQFEAGLVISMPVPINTSWRDQLGKKTQRLTCVVRESQSDEEPSWVMHAIQEMNTLSVEVTNEILIAELLTELNKIAEQAYSFTAYEIQPDSVTTMEAAAKELCKTKSRDGRCSSAISLFFGLSYGRWDLRLLQKPELEPSLPDPFDPLPIFPPAMLIGTDGLPAEPSHIVSEEWLHARSDANTLPSTGSIKQPTISDSEYPIEVKWDGILVDDPDHPDDIIQRVRGVMATLWGERAEAMEQEACEILGVRELRDYFRKPGNGGFWMDHVKRYSKSRRKAPIYWLLQSSKKNYAIWLYYHRLDKDILFKALVEYVQPKLRLEEDRLKQLRDRRKEVGLSGREAKQLEKELDRQEAFLSELQDFHDNLKRAADLNFEPDLNDGVVLNIAPLWELVPWKEAKKYWDELRAEKYEWSSIGKQLREKGMVG